MSTTQYCRDIQPALEDVFGQPDGPEVFVQLTGQRDVWKSPENPLRAAPYGVKRVPTLIAFEDVRLSPPPLSLLAVSRADTACERD